MTAQTHQPLNQELLAGEEELLVPRLVARIAELEHALYSSQLKLQGGEGHHGSSNIMDRFSSLIKRAQQGLDASVAYLVGEAEGWPNQQPSGAAGAAAGGAAGSSAGSAAEQALTKEATAKALVITLKKLEGLRDEKVAAEEQAAALAAQLQAAQAALGAAEAQREALAAEHSRLAAATEELSSQRSHDQVALAAAAAELVTLRSAQAAAAGQSSQQVEQLQAQHKEAAATQAAQFEAAAAQLRREAEGHAAQVGELRQQLAAAQAQAAGLSAQLEASQRECEQLRLQLVGAGEAAAAADALAEEQRAARVALSQELDDTRSQLQQSRSDAQEFQRRFLQERQERRKVHEQLQVLRGNIRVLCRVRPLATDKEQAAVTFPLPDTIAVHPGPNRVQEFEFDCVFDGSSSQEAVFDEVAPLVRSCADGYNVCIFAYGQTGSGKTHTMQGPESNPGLSVRALQALFEITASESADSGAHRTISVSMLEIYNEAVRDLLKGGADALKPMEVSGMGAGQLPAGADRVPGLTWRPVSSVADVLSVLAEGTRSRATASTALNAHSSRSHALLSVKLSDPAGRSPPCLLHLVDLAGSERILKSEVAGQQLKEAQAINKSLSALGDVISSLQAKSGHVPYRNSKLTQVLQDSLCGSSKVLLVCCVSPEAASAQESLSSLGFAQRAAQVELGPVKKVQDQAVRKAAAADPTAGKAGSPLTPGMGKSRLGAGTPASAGIKRSALKDANTPL